MSSFMHQDDHGAREDASGSNENNAVNRDDEGEVNGSAPETASTVYTPAAGSTFTYPETVQQTPTPTPKKAPRRISIAAIAVLLVLCLVLAIVGGAAGMMIALAVSENTPNDGEYTGDGVGTDNSPTEGETVNLYKENANVNVVTLPEGNEELSISQVYAKVVNSVVAITTSIQTNSAYHGGYYVTKGSGSGVVISEGGHIVTNYHVVDGANEITVRLLNGMEYKAVCLDGDVAMDIALLKIESDTALTPVEIGASDDHVIGQDVVAIGNPLGNLPGTVTDGIVSALERTITIEGYSRKVIQTNAAISPGNSGGGLFDRFGRLVGIVNAKNSSEGAEGLGFAIPIDAVFDDIVEIIEDGYIHGRACLGLDTKAITNVNDAFYYYRNQNIGVYIQASYYEVGVDLREGDRIHSVNGVEIKAESDLNALMSTLQPGDEVTLVVGRIQVVSSGIWTNYKEEYLEATVELIEYVPSFSINFH
ncbi:MAG: trypsin-like peptidase domain-containing protein [Clostridia bacterium]|nr:trypsin-like peptidase domain-containing protein [Clostridia bacterium]